MAYEPIKSGYPTLQLLLTLYWKARTVCYINYMEGAKLLYDWLGPAEATPTYPWWKAPDVCTACGYRYEVDTPAGRLRSWCDNCKSPRDAIGDYELQELARHFHSSRSAIELILAYVGADCKAYELYTASDNCAKDSIAQLQHNSPPLQT